MARHKSSEKRARQSVRRRARHLQLLSKMRSLKRKVVEAATAEERAAALREFQSSVDRTARRKIVHPRTAARMKSRLAKNIAKK